MYVVVPRRVLWTFGWCGIGAVPPEAGGVKYVVTPTWLLDFGGIAIVVKVGAGEVAELSEVWSVGGTDAGCTGGWNDCVWPIAGVEFQWCASGR